MAVERAVGPTFWLPKHVHFCSTETGVIFLDLRADRYFGLSDAQARVLQTVVEGWSATGLATPAEDSANHERACTVAEQLFEMGLLTRDARQGRLARPASAPQEYLMGAAGLALELRRKIRLRDVARFAMACISAAVSLRFLELETVVRRATARKVRHQGSQTTPPENLNEIVAAFRTLRSYTFTARGKCLFHSVALINFLAAYGIYPTWVIGVRTSPFGAHSWVQHGKYVLDATPESMCFYTPILSI